LKYAFEKISWRNFDNDYFPALKLGTSTLESDVDGLLFDVFFENQMGLILWNTKKLTTEYETYLMQPANEILALIEQELAKYPDDQLETNVNTPDKITPASAD
jgi:hypothetical protein